ncbi:unnamed protein product [Clonostachys rosea]|uniref:N-acetyl-D-glucosamine kinase n=1 Tax=Bionectria ochroleuca TaxID=29856 RepID=A0ABY6UWZ4_BIOOC|nr:unnamed protein product [Clonostachys rosea]
MADKRLGRSDEAFSHVPEEHGRSNEVTVQAKYLERLVLCVDAGGTSCRAALLSANGEIASSIGGPCNVTTSGLDVTLVTISKVVQDAINNHQETRGQPLRKITFSQVWVGLAGYDRPSLKPHIDAALSELFRLPLNKGLKVSSDIDLLPAALSSRQNITSAIVLVVGTGAIAMSYKRDGNEFQRIGRAGGWGRLFGDDGSGYATGREGIRKALRHCDLHCLKRAIGATPPPFPPLAKAILEHFQALYPDCNAENLLGTLLVPKPVLHGQDDGDLLRTKDIASAASVVISMVTKDLEAKQIMESGADSVAELVKILVKEQSIDVARCALVLGGGLMKASVYKESVLSHIETYSGEFSYIASVDQPVIAGVRHLLDCKQN